MTITKETLAKLDKEIEKEVRELNDLHRAAKYKKKNIFVLQAEQKRLYERILNKM